MTSKALCARRRRTASGLETWRQFFSELPQCFVVFGEPGGQVFDSQGQAFGFGTGDSEYGAGAV